MAAYRAQNVERILERLRSVHPLAGVAAGAHLTTICDAGDLVVALERLQGAVGILEQAVEELDGLDGSDAELAELTADFVTVAKAFLANRGGRSDQAAAREEGQ